MSEGRVQVWEIYIVLNLAINVSLTLHRFCIHGVAGMLRPLTHAEMNWTHVSGDILIWACVWMVQLENSTQSSVMLLILPINPCHMHKTAACTISSSPDPEDRPCVVIPVWSRYQIVPKGHSGSFKSVFLGDTENLPSGSVLPIPDHPHLMLASHPFIILFITLFLPQSLYESFKSPTDDVLMRTDFCSSTCLSVSLTLVLCSTQLGGSETEADTLTHSFALPTMIIHMDYTSLPQWRERERDVEDGGWVRGMYWNREIKWKRKEWVRGRVCVIVFLEMVCQLSQTHSVYLDTEATLKMYDCHCTSGICAQMMLDIYSS